MSVQAMTWVFDHSTATGGERLVLLAIANHYSRDGLACPGYDLLAQEARLSRSATIRAVARLEEHGHVKVERDPTPGRSKVNRYIIIGFDEGSRNATLPDGKGSRPAPERVASDTEKGSRPRDPNQEIEPREEPIRRARARNPLFDALVIAFGEASTDTRASFYGKCVRELKAIDATPEQVIAARAEMTKRGWSEPSPNAMLKHWDDLLRTARPSGPPGSKWDRQAEREAGGQP